MEHQQQCAELLHPITVKDVICVMVAGHFVSFPLQHEFDLLAQERSDGAPKIGSEFVWYRYSVTLVSVGFLCPLLHNFHSRSHGQSNRPQSQ